jgi:hypothetical protein
MSRKISKNPVKREREKKRIKNLEKEGRIIKGVEIPKDVLPSDPDSQKHGGGYSAKFFYKDIHYTCEGCGKKEVWTAQQQKKYFEIQKGNIYNEPKWCYDCHSKRMENKNK